jgi:DNA invertase Pin-like site-specific DNA recombinase
MRLVDRPARKERAIDPGVLNVLDLVAKAGAGFRALKDTWQTRPPPHGRLMLTVLGGLAAFEREAICSRTGEGRSRRPVECVLRTMRQLADSQDLDL